MPPSRWSSIEYALDWPAALLCDELVALLNEPFWSWTPGDVDGLLREAFHTDAPAEEFARVSAHDDWHHFEFDEDDHAAPARPAGQRWVLDLLNTHLGEVRRHSPRPPLWRARQRRDDHGSRSPEPRLPGTRSDGPRPGRPRLAGPNPPDVRRDFALLAIELAGRGYLAQRFPRDCVDADRDEHGELPHHGVDPQDRIRAELQHQLHEAEPGLWPPAWDLWDIEVFFDLTEALHDLVSRPRRYWIHDERECGRHYEDFDPAAGRRIYRTLVNEILDRHDVGLHLAADGPEDGRLVHVVDDARSDLLERSTASPDPVTRDQVVHAITLFRGREATTEDKRSAVIALARVLEPRRALIRHDIGAKDEDVLFRLANEFDLRHQRRGQQKDYDPAFLDWMFWWYLATIELTNRIIARQGAEAST